MKTVNDNKRSLNYCLIGEKLGHSYSREIHEEMGFNYILKEVSANDLPNFLNNNNFYGFNVTIPYKKAVIPYLTETSNIAKMAGAVNTVVNVNGKLYGHNTDVEGMKYMISRKGVSLTGKKVMLLGSGGTSNTAVTLCKLENAEKVTVVSRSGSVNYDNCYELQDTEVIINSTPVGMYPNVENTPINLSKFKNLIAVFDCVYNPFLTELLSDAKKLGLIYSNGISMLVKQAILAEDFWLNVDSGNDETERIIKKMQLDKSNLVLYGMPSSGKSTIGKLVAKKLNRSFIDTDEYIEKITGKSPSKIINEQGILEFRRIESEVIKEVSKLSGYVIALGGGAVLNEQNVHALKRNGHLIYVKRNLSLLVNDDRPLSKKYGVEQLYNERKDIYSAVKDGEVDNNSDLESAVEGVIKTYENSCN